MPTANHHDRHFLHTRTAVKTVIFYAVIACLWIYFSDTILSLFIKDAHRLTQAQTVKGIVYVVVTALLLYLYLTHCLQSLRVREEEIEAEKEQAQREAQQRLNQLNTLFDSMNAIVYVADLETYELLYVNKYAAEHFGRDWHNRKCYHYLQSGQDRPCVFCTNPQLTVNGEAGEPVVWEFLNTKNNRWYDCFDKAIRWTDGRLVRLEVALDVTERKELEKIKDDLLSSMSHEMRTPLTAISGFTELLLNEPGLPEEQSRHLEIIYREAEKLNELVNRFLDVRRLKVDRSRVNYEQLNVAELLHNARKNCRDCKEQHDILFACPNDVRVYGNRKELVQVFKQVLDNACLYSPGGGLIKVTVEPSEDQVAISFTDSGIGIPEHEHESIFEPFHRLDVGDTRKTGGVGLGLSVAREIVSLHGGSIMLESQPGHGSTFCIKLPQADNIQSRDN